MNPIGDWLTYPWCMNVSVGVLAVFVAWAAWVHWSKGRDRRTFTAMQVVTMGVFLALIALFVPVYYKNYPLEDGKYYVRPALLAIHNTLRVFILDGEFNVIRDALEAAGISPEQMASYGLYAALLYVGAPFLTFTFVLSLFKNVMARIGFLGHWFRPHYIMSELNERSMALAESIFKKNNRARIVFTDVFEQNEEGDYELLGRARNVHAICLRQDITQLNVRFKRSVEFFLIGEDESENISQATKIAAERRRHPRKKNVKVFVFATSMESEYMVGSIACYAFPEERKENDEDQGRKKPVQTEPNFVLRRVDAVEKLVWNEMPNMDVFGRADENGVISVLLVGMGKYGMAFFRNLIWFCQASGYRLELNVVDKRKGSDGIRSFLRQHCPELMEKNHLVEDGEACYSVEFFEGVDMEGEGFDRVFHYQGDNAVLRNRAERLRRTAIAVVAMGDDDRNIRVAMDLRLRFDRLHGIAAGEKQTFDQEQVAIYSVVYDEQKTSILVSGSQSDQRLMNYKKVPFNIHFIGKLSVQYDYAKIYEPGLERDAFRYHSLWVRQNANAWRELQAMTEEELEEAKEEWPGLRKFLEEGGFSAGELEERKAEDRRAYEQFEYFRKSSMARALHSKALKKAFPHRIDCTRGRKQICMCENCVWRKKTEHMRWNAYMRMLGYKTGAKHISRAKLHGDLVSWNALPWKTQIKD